MSDLAMKAALAAAWDQISHCERSDSGSWCTVHESRLPRVWRTNETCIYAADIICVAEAAADAAREQLAREVVELAPPELAFREVYSGENVLKVFQSGWHECRIAARDKIRGVR